ncbi:MAG: V-type ATP synthase subunit F [Pseudomonadota bacterium]
MAALVFIGDEVTAAGYRLAGMRILLPELSAVGQALHEASAAAELVLITAEYAARLPPAHLRSALSARKPLVLVVPDARNRTELPELAARMRAQLGIEL